MAESPQNETEEIPMQEVQEPSVTSSDPNERKLARRLRIERRIEALRRAEMPEGEVEPTPEEQPKEKSMVEKQLEKSSHILDKLITESYEQVSNVRVANESREVDRREIESLHREDLIKALDDEAKSAADMFDEIASHWGEILKYHDPLDIHDEMDSQKEKCEALLKQKDGIIAMLREEIRKAEIKFSNDQKKQNEDINNLTSRIEMQIKAMRSAYKQELRYIDEVIMEERKIFVEMNNRKWEELYKKREVEEEKLVRRKFEQQEEFIKEMDAVRKAHQEKYREVRIKLEREVEELQKEFETIKTAAIMNGEILDYNFQILRKREDENLVLNSQQKRRINKLQDFANNIRKKNQDYEEKTNININRYTKEVQNLQKSVVDIKTKAINLSRMNDTKFQQIWELNAQNANKLVNRIMGIDKVLYEQQMGVEWKKPDGVLLAQKQLPSYAKAVEVLGGDSKSEDSKMLAKSKASRTPSETSKGDKKVLEPPKDPTTYNRLLRHIMERVAERSGFLMEKRLEDLLKPYLDDQKDMVRVDNVFSALGIKEQENIDQMCHFFLPYAKCAICVKSTAPSAKGSEKFSVTALEDANTSDSSLSIEEPLYKRIQQTIAQPEEVISEIVHNLVVKEDDSESTLTGCASTSADECMPPSIKSEKDELQTITISKRSIHSQKFLCRFNHPLQVSPAFVIKALREFLAAYFQDVTSLDLSSQTQKHDTLSRLMTDDDIKLFWSKYKTIFSVSRMRMWDGLFMGLQKYYEMLKDRRKLNDEVLCLRMQNVELQRLLSRYEKQRATRPPCAGQRQFPFEPYRPKPYK